MPGDERPHHLRTSFDLAAEDYDAVRPGYPAEIIADVVTLAALPAPARICEVGCGTGQATMPFARRGDHLTCLDIGASLLALARKKFADYPNVCFHQSAFEDWSAGPGEFDLVLSATAFHWIAPEVGYLKAAALLRPSGSLAILANEHRAFAPGFADDLHEIERRIVPDWPDPRIPPQPPATTAKTVVAIDSTGLFAPVIVRTHPWSQTYTTEDYLRLLNTYSNYRALDLATRMELFREIAEMVDRGHRGTVTKHYVAVVYLARKGR